LATTPVGCERERTDESTPPKLVEPEPEPPSPPKLVVVVVVDQMRFDYYERFGPQWHGGFAQARERGRFYTQARHAHALTETAPGHATIATGTHPSRHGVVANNWLDRTTNNSKVEAVADPNTTLIGSDKPGDGASPFALLRDGVGDWLQAVHPEAIVISLSIKDRAAILLGGKHPDAAIWYEDELGGYTSSTWYGETLPAWVEAYNQKDRAAALYGEQGWVLRENDDVYGDARRQTDPKFVSAFGDYALTKQFPHVIDVEGKLPRHVIRDTPFGDRMTLELALEAVAAEGMGADAVPDLLLLSLSGGDYAGHRYGPNSVEIRDYYLHMDEALGEFIGALDQRLGDDYVLILTSDHGVAPIPEYSDIETAGRFVGKTDVPPELAATVKALKLSKKHKPEFTYTHGVELAFPETVDEPKQIEVRSELARRLRELDDLADAWTRDELLGGEDRTEFAAAWRYSFHPERSAQILLQYAPGVVMYAEGTGHGTPYDYDQHVPLVIVGPGIAGTWTEPVRSVDIAPTIAALIELAIPTDLDGVPLPLPRPRQRQL
jgi:predicted AlkP superfamily pyrophosphatase or phosphodiesterase